MQNCLKCEKLVFLRTCSKSLRSTASSVRTVRRNRSLDGVNEDFEHCPSTNRKGVVGLVQVLRNSNELSSPTAIGLLCVSIILLCLLTGRASAADYSVTVITGNTELVGNIYHFNTELEYNLSPTAKEALQKGIPLTWIVNIKVEQQADFWNTTLQEKKITYQIHNHALLNQYSVKINNDLPLMFATLTGALNSMSKINAIAMINKQFIHQDRSYQIAVKVTFDREALPIPLRPLSYFDSQWALSSGWTVWPLSK